jgi:hydroxymethylbilane synthase
MLDRTTARPIMATPIRIGTRGSPLALWQANNVAGHLRAIPGAHGVELVIIQTQGDQVRDQPLSTIGGDGLFTKAIQDAVLAGRADIAVHSLKDLPTAPVPGLVLAAVPARGATGDAFVSRRFRRFDELPPGARIATGSLRRKAQVRNRRPDLELVEIRGNVDTRLRKLRETDLDALIMAQAGLERLELASEITEILDPKWMLPAVGQGALGLECRTGDEASRQLLAQLDDLATHQAVAAERAFLFALGGGCLVPIGASAVVSNGQLSLRGTVLSADGSERLSGESSGLATQATEVGKELAARMLGKGAKKLLSQV